jgi:hypothetical protein
MVSWLYNLIGYAAALFVVYCSLPMFIFLTVYLVGLRDFNKYFDFRGFAANLIRRFLL